MAIQNTTLSNYMREHLFMREGVRDPLSPQNSVWLRFTANHGKKGNGQE